MNDELFKQFLKELDEAPEDFSPRAFFVASPTTLFLFFSPNTVRLSQDCERCGIAL